MILYKLLAIFLMVASGWVAAQLGWLGKVPRASGQALDGSSQVSPSAATSAAAAVAGRVLSDVAFYLFVPALLFRTMVLQDFASLPWRPIAAFFVPAVAYLLIVYASRRQALLARGAAAPATFTVSATYGNSVQMGIPVAAALFGDAGVTLHITLTSLHGLLLLVLMTALAELDLARHGRTASRWATVRTTARQAVIHPVVLPLLMGMAWNATGWGLHPALDEALLGLSRAVVPVCLLLIGVNLAQYGLRGRMRGALGTGVLKLFVLPACVLLFAHTVVHLSGMELAVVLLMAALPTGSNALIFAHRYRTLEAEATAAIVLTTVAYAATASLWLWVLGQFFP